MIPYKKVCTARRRKSWEGGCESAAADMVVKIITCMHTEKFVSYAYINDIKPHSFSPVDMTHLKMALFLDTCGTAKPTK